MPDEQPSGFYPYLSTAVLASLASLQERMVSGSSTPLPASPIPSVIHKENLIAAPLWKKPPSTGAPYVRWGRGMAQICCLPESSILHFLTGASKPLDDPVLWSSSRTWVMKELVSTGISIQVR
jgi:hypothetical protein